MPEEIKPGQDGGTGTPTTPAPEPKPGNANNPEPNKVGADKQFTQEQVNEIIKDRLAQQEHSILKKLGVEKFEDVGKEIASGKLARQELILSKNNIAEGRYDDVLTHFKGKGQELSDEALKEVVKTHPEWVKQTAKPEPKQDGFFNLGHPEHKDEGKNEWDEVNKMFGTHIGENRKHRI